MIRRIRGWYAVSCSLGYNLPMGLTAEMCLMVGVRTLPIGFRGNRSIDLSELPADCVIDSQGGRMSTCRFVYNNDRSLLVFTIDYNIANYGNRFHPFLELEQLWRQIRQRDFSDIKSKWLVN